MAETKKYLDHEGLTTYDEKIKTWVQQIPSGIYKGKIQSQTLGSKQSLNLKSGNIKSGWWYLLTNEFTENGQLHAPGDILYCTTTHFYNIVEGLNSSNWVWLNNSREYKIDTLNTQNVNYHITFSDKPNLESGSYHSRITDAFTYNPSTKKLSGVNSVDGLDATITFQDLLINNPADTLSSGPIRDIQTLTQTDGKLDIDEIQASTKTVCPLSNTEIEAIFDQEWGEIGDGPAAVSAPINPGPILPLT